MSPPVGDNLEEGEKGGGELGRTRTGLRTTTWD